MRWVVPLVLLAAQAQAQRFAPRDIDGMGRISISPGVNITANDYTWSRAAEKGFPLERTFPVNPSGIISFGYGATAIIEASIDLFITHTQFSLAGKGDYALTCYGATVGGRLTKMDLWVRGLVAWVGIFVGPHLDFLRNPTVDNGGRETFQTVFGGGGGLAFRFTERVGLNLDLRYHYVRSAVPEISGINVGGFFGTLGVTIYLPGAPDSQSRPTAGF